MSVSPAVKKRNEILQMAMLEPKLAILDETDSGLDIDALKTVAEGVNALRAPERGMLVITHYQRLLDFIKPDVVHVMAEGRIVKSGGPNWHSSWKNRAMPSIGKRRMLEAQTRFDAVKAALPGDMAARETALAAAEASGLPTRRVESWHYTDLPRLLKTDGADRLDAVNFIGVDALMAVFDDGVPETQPQADGLTIKPLTARRQFSGDAMAQYNAALAQGGLVVEIDGALHKPLVVTTGGMADVHLAHKVTLAQGAKAVLADNHMATGYTNAVFDIELGAGAELLLIRSQQAGHQIGQSRVTLAEGANYKSVALVTGGALARHEAQVSLTAANAHAELHSAVLGLGKTHADFTYVIDHQYGKYEQQYICL